MMMTKRRDDESGRWSQEYTEDDVLEALEGLCGSATAKEVAEQVGCSKDTAYRRLTALCDDGRLNRRRVGQTFEFSVDEI